MSLVASAQIIALDDLTEAKRLASRRQEWQREAWDLFDELGELKDAVNYVANAVARVMLYVGTWPEDPTGIPDRIEDQGILDELRSRVAGHADVLRAITQNLIVAGECYAIGRAPSPDADLDLAVVLPGSRSWDVYSIDEIKIDTGGKIGILDGKEATPLTDRDKFIRIWLRHPRWASKADSPVHGVLAIGQEILMLQRMIRAQVRSRLAAIGVLYIDSNLANGPADPTRDAQDGFADNSPFVTAFMETAMRNIAEEGAAAACVPIVIEGDGPLEDRIVYIPFENPVSKELVERLEHSITRLAQGLPVPVEIITGLGSANHWGAGQIEEQAFKAYIEPLIVAIVEALTTGLIEDEAQVIWYDPTPVVIKANRTEDAKYLHANGRLSDEALVRTLGFSVEDLPSTTEMLRNLLLDKGMVGTSLTVALIEQVMGVPIEVESSPAPDSEPDETPTEETDDEIEEPTDPTDPPVVASANGRDLKDTALRMVLLDAKLRERIWTALDAEVTRALERIGAKLRTAAVRDPSILASIDGVANTDIVAHLGDTMTASLGVDIEGELERAVDGFAPRFDAWVADAQAGALAIIDVTPSEAVSAAQALDRARAWQSLRGAALEVARVQLGAPSVDGQGFRVPFERIREAVAVAGGR